MGRTKSRREVIAETLNRMNISVDKFGHCGVKLPESAWNNETFFKQYKFYLAFENSLCDEYVTEKLYRGLNSSQHFGLIPIVYGGANYSSMLPNQSYVNVDDFTDIATLVQYLHKLKQAESHLIESFYQWHLNWHVSDLEMFRHLNGWQTLCKNIWNYGSKDENVNFLKNIESLLGKCYLPHI